MQLPERVDVVNELTFVELAEAEGTTVGEMVVPEDPGDADVPVVLFAGAVEVAV